MPRTLTKDELLKRVHKELEEAERHGRRAQDLLAKLDALEKGGSA